VVLLVRFFSGLRLLVSVGTQRFAVMFLFLMDFLVVRYVSGIAQFGAPR